MRRKRIKINTVGTAVQKRRYATQVCHRLATQLDAGRNPWVGAGLVLTACGAEFFLFGTETFVLDPQVAAPAGQLSDFLYKSLLDE